MHKKSVCLLGGSITPSNLRLQPWRYLHESARQLIAQGHAVTIISDGEPTPDEQIAGVPVRRIAPLERTRGRTNAALDAALAELRPDVLLWHVGTTSFLPHRAFEHTIPTIGIFTSPMYTARELARLGARRLAKGYKLSAIHLLGAAVPASVVRRGVAASGLRRLVVQTQSTHDRLVEHGVDADMIEIIRPGVDPAWVRPGFVAHDLRTTLGFEPSDAVVVYFGSPAPLRGLHTLIEAVAVARRTQPRLKLLVLSRRRADELVHEDADLGRLLGRADAQEFVKVFSGFLPEAELVAHVAAADITALPFEIIPSDAPLSVLEAQALAKPIVVTTVGCLAELASHGPTYLAQPADPVSLAEALVRAANDLAPSGTTAPPTLPNRMWQETGAEWSRLVEQL